MLQPDNNPAKKPAVPPNDGTTGAGSPPSADAQPQELSASQLSSPHKTLERTYLQALVYRCERLLAKTEDGEVTTSLGDQCDSRLIQLEGAGWLARVKSRLDPEGALSRALQAMDDLGESLEVTKLGRIESNCSALDTIGLYGASLLDRSVDEMRSLLKAARDALERTSPFQGYEEENYTSIGVPLHHFAGALITNGDLESLEALLSMQLPVQLRVSLLHGLIHRAQIGGDKSRLESIEPLLRRAYTEVEIEWDSLSDDLQTSALLTSARLDASLGKGESAAATLRNVSIDGNIEHAVGAIYGINAAWHCAASCTDAYNMATKEIRHAFGLIDSDQPDQGERSRQSFFWSYCDGIAIGSRLAGSQAAVAPYVSALLKEFPEMGIKACAWTKVIALLTMGQPREKQSAFLLSNLKRCMMACENPRELKELLGNFANDCLRKGLLPPGRERDNLAQGLVDVLLSLENSPLVTLEFPLVLRDLQEAGYQKLALSLQPDRFCADLDRLPWIILRHHIEQPSEALDLTKEFEVAMLGYLASRDDALDNAKDRLENGDYNETKHSRALDELLVSLSKYYSDTVGSYAHRLLDLIPELMRYGYIEQGDLFLLNVEKAAELLSGWHKENLVRRMCQTLCLGVEEYLEEYPALAVAGFRKYPG